VEHELRERLPRVDPAKTHAETSRSQNVISSHGLVAYEFTKQGSSFKAALYDL
jgi:hypothetical protein